jgi:DNA-binding CsgD family transcriptional regulator
MISIEKFIEDTNAAETPEDVFDLFLSALRECGYDRVCYSLITDHPSLDLKAGHGIFQNYPGDWMTYYMSKGYQCVDPVPKHCFNTIRPFTWDALDQARPMSKSENLVMNEAHEAKLLSGAAIPLHGPNGELAGVGLASSAGQAECDPVTLAKIQAISFQFHIAYTDQNKKRPSLKGVVILTSREKEILLWAAEGKSDYVIADIIGVSYPTIRFHMNNIFRKLQANDRILAVVKAIRLGLILPTYVMK